MFVPLLIHIAQHYENERIGSNRRGKAILPGKLQKPGDYIKTQLDSGIDPPKIDLELDFIKDYFKNNDLAHRDLDLVVEELIEIGVIDKDWIS